jgi:hypothetical protein
MAFFIVTAMKTSNLTIKDILHSVNAHVSNDNSINSSDNDDICGKNHKIYI